MFRVRLDAGQQLAWRLRHLQGAKPVVLGILRGGVPVAFEVARHLDGTLGMIWVKKIGAPGNPEYALGAMTDQKEIVWSDLTPTDEDYVRQVVRRRERELEDWRSRFGFATPLDVCLDRVVVVVDDGIATGSSMKAALRRVRAFRPSRLVAAVPVAPVEALESVKEEADEVVALLTPSNFYAVGGYYHDFRPVNDEDVAAYFGHSAP